MPRCLLCRGVYVADEIDLYKLQCKNCAELNKPNLELDYREDIDYSQWP